MQLTLWSLERMQELEEAHLLPGVNGAPAPERDFQWCTPWLRGNGQVIVRDERGRWVLADPTHPTAEAYRVRLSWAHPMHFGSELWAVFDLLERARMVQEVMAETKAVLTAERVMA